MANLFGKKTSKNELIETLQATNLPIQALSLPAQDYLKSINVKKKTGRYGLAGLALTEILVAGSFSGQISDSDFQNRIARETAIRDQGYVEFVTGTYEGETDFGYLEGIGKFTFDSGSVYEGVFDDNEMSGIGTLYIPSEGTYEGEFWDSMKHGSGVYTWSDGTIYDGQWSADQMSGEGVYTSSVGVVYSGTFRENAFYEGKCTFDNTTGKYELTFANGAIETAKILFTDGTVYEGECSYDGIDGEGTMTFTSGDIYAGTFSESKRSGSGTYTWITGDIYNGEWIDDKMSGTGTYTYESGSYASGTFLDNQFTDGSYYIENDFGKYTFTITESEPTAVNMTLESGTTYEGEIKDGQLSGTANIKYENGDKYSGNVLEGKKSGQGVYSWTSGASYDGSWSEDQMSGNGTYMYPSSEEGYKLTGSFENGKPNGVCQYYTNASTHYKTDWTKGKCVKVYE